MYELTVLAAAVPNPQPSACGVEIRPDGRGLKREQRPIYRMALIVVK